MSHDLLRTLPQYFIPKHGLTLLAGYLADVKNTRIKNYIIRRFINKFRVDMSEALIEEPTAYTHFNDFFIRKLKPQCRPLAAADIISPVDGLVSELGSIETGQLIQAKGRTYSVKELLACSDEQAETFINGRFATLYLSPKDYHRVHLPMDAELLSMTYVPGTLFSVQPATVQVVPKLFARNERLVISFSTQAGPMVMVLVGATIVGAIGTTWHGDLQRAKKSTHFDYTKIEMHKMLRKGDEVGYFKLGSTVILLFADGNQVHWHHKIRAGHPIRFGEELGELRSTRA